MRGVGAGNGARPSSGLRRRDSDQLYGVEDEAGGGDGSTDMNKRKKKKDDKVPFTAEVRETISETYGRVFFNDSPETVGERRILIWRAKLPRCHFKSSLFPSLF